MEFSQLLVLLFGLFVGWLIKHWLNRDEIADLRRQSQFNQVGSRTQSDSVYIDRPLLADGNESSTTPGSNNRVSAVSAS